MHTQGNILSLLVFFVWVPMALWGAKRWPPAKTAAILLLVPLMFLPEKVYFKAPGFPRFTKDEIAVFWLFIGVLLFHRDRLRTVVLGRWIKLSMALLMGGAVCTVLLNSDPIRDGTVYLVAHRPYDAWHAVLVDLFSYVLPFVLAAAMFRTRQDLRTLLRLIVAAALVYSLFQMFELRFSPQLHRWIYGFFQHSFRQTIRAGGYRPTVFMSHGLAVGLFTMVAVLAAAGLNKAKVRVFGFPAKYAMGYLWLLLSVSKSVAALLYSVVALPMVWFLSPKSQYRIATGIALIVLLYPTLRGADLVPVEEIRDWVQEQYGDERVTSIMTRFVNEKNLLEKASERPFFGWGTFGRASLYNPKTGWQTATRDGDWIITWGEFGRVGFFGKYLLMLLPIFIGARRLKLVRRLSDRRLLATLALMVAFSVFDLLPNGNFNYLVTVLAGALLGCSEGIVRQQAHARWVKRKQASLNAGSPSGTMEDDEQRETQPRPLRGRGPSEAF